MEILDNFSNYRKHKPEYKNWKSERNAKEQARLDYIKKNNISEAQKQEDIKRAKAVLNAVDIMDEYSQTRAEDMELVVQQVTQGLSQPLAFVSMGVGGLLNFIKPLRNFAIKIAQRVAKCDAKDAKFYGSLGLAMVGAFAGVLAVVPFMSAWGARKELEASRMGRLEAMNKELASVKQFAVLDEKQEQEVEQIAQGIEIPKEEKKKGFSASNGFGIKKSIELLKNGDDEYQDYKKELDKKAQEDKAKFDTAKLTDEDILEAQKDKQLIQNIVEKIDIASQDYAENIELATGVMASASLGAGGLLGMGVFSLLNALKVKKAGIIALIVGFGSIIPGDIIATKLQKQGSRVARHKVKEELLNNPEQLLYVDESKIKADNVEPYKKEKTNIFKFLVQAFKDNKEYNEYQKAHAAQNKQRAQAKEQITLTKEQEARAHQLQQNVFKMFNKLDEKSQSFSESVEAIGETIQSYIALLPAVFMGVKSGKLVESYFETGKLDKKSIIGMALSLIPVIVINSIVTKEQKNASRVADMMAINEMDDYRNFVDFSNTGKASKKEASKQEKKENSTQILSNLTPPWLKKN